MCEILHSLFAFRADILQTYYIQFNFNGLDSGQKWILIWMSLYLCSCQMLKRLYQKHDQLNIDFKHAININVHKLLLIVILFVNGGHTYAYQ